jgi:hypothetical protein
MTRDEFCRLVRVFRYGHDLVDKATDELIAEGMRLLPNPHASRLGFIIGVPPEEWYSISLPRLDGKGYIKPRLVHYAVKEFRNLCLHMRRVARSARFQTRSQQLNCPYCGELLEIELRKGGLSNVEKV